MCEKQPNSLQGSITRMKAESARLWATAQSLKRLAEKYPGLRAHQDRWNTVRYCSKVINGRVNRIEVRHNCGCCDDSPLEIWPYIEDDRPEHFRIYSDPPSFMVAEKNSSGTGERPYPDWEDGFRSCQISQEIIEQVGDFLKRNPPEDFDKDN